MIIADHKFYALFGSIGLIFTGLLAIIFNKTSAKVWVKITNDFIGSIFSKANKVSNNGFLFNVFRIFTVLIGVLALTEAFFILRKLILVI